MKKICIVKLGHYPELLRIKRDAETLHEDGYQVDVICCRLKGQKAKEVVNGVNVYRLPGEHRRTSVLRYLFEYSHFFIQASFVLSWLHLKKRYDIIEVYSMPDFLVFTSIIPKLLGAKVILHLLENMPQLFGDTYQKDQNNTVISLLHFVEKISARYAHHIFVADGNPYKHQLESRGIPSEKMTIILNVPGDNLPDPESIANCKNGDQFRLIVSSTLTERYGVQVLIQAVALLLDDIPDLRVDITGKGEYRSQLEQLVNNLGVDKCVNFTGLLPYECYVMRIAQAHVAVAPMIYDIGISSKLFDYFALGTPAVASALPSLVATFSSDCVLYFQPGNERELADRILELYHSPAKRSSIAAYGQEFYRKCRWEVTKYEYLKTFEEYLKP